MVRFLAKCSSVFSFSSSHSTEPTLKTGADAPRSQFTQRVKVHVMEEAAPCSNGIPTFSECLWTLSLHQTALAWEQHINNHLKASPAPLAASEQEHRCRFLS